MLGNCSSMPYMTRIENIVFTFNKDIRSGKLELVFSNVRLFYMLCQAGYLWSCTLDYSERMGVERFY